MAKYANPGEMRTKIFIEKNDKVSDAAGYVIDNWKNVFPQNAFVFCKWVNAHGMELMESQRFNLKNLATLTLRYSQKIDETCRIIKPGEKIPYNIISVDDVEDQHEWMEIKVARKVEAV